MKEKTLALTLIFALSLTIMPALTQTADANFVGLLAGLRAITIQSDGTVNPQTEYITQEGNTYKLTADLQKKYRIVIDCSNIVFDGQDHLINGSGSVFWQNEWHGYNSEGITVEKQSNVTIKNIQITGFEKPAIYISDCSEISILRVQTTELIRFSCSENNIVSASKIRLNLMDSNNNVISENEIRLGVLQSKNNLIYMNNISSVSLDSSYANFWDNGSIGNYWIDYLDKCPDALEIGDTGKADKPYVIDENNIDNHPFMHPVSVEQEPDPSTQGTSTKDLQEASPLPVTLVAGVSAILIAVVVAGVVYQRKMAHGKNAIGQPKITENLFFLCFFACLACPVCFADARNKKDNRSSRQQQR